MFQAGIVAPSSVFLLQLLTVPEVDLVSFPLVEEVGLVSDNLDGVQRPVACDVCCENVELASLTLLAPRARPYGGPEAENPPVLCGVTTPAFDFSPMVLGKRLGSTEWALLLKAAMHCST